MTAAALFIFGLILGSFVNALVWRLHSQQKAKSKKQKAQYSITRGRSMCVHCSHTLAVKDLIPVLSWLWLKGKCRYCHKPISIQYPLVELTTAILVVISYIYWSNNINAQCSMLNAQCLSGVVDFGVWLVALTGFMALIIYDLRWMILPNKIIFPLLGLAGFSIAAQCIINSSPEPAKTAIWGVLIGGGLFYLLFQISDGRWIGGGDVKLGFLLGLIVGGPAMAFLMIFLASLLGSVYSIPLLARGKLAAKTKLPFGPFLITGAIITELFGSSVIDWYSSTFIV